MRFASYIVDRFNFLVGIKLMVFGPTPRCDDGHIEGSFGVVILLNGKSYG